MPGFIGVHVGAGYHSEKYHDQYRKLCNSACEKGIDVLRCGGTAVEAASVATAVLEDSTLTNAGFGSNLTWDGRVECDSSVMDGKSLHYGAVGAVSGVKNPVFLAKAVFEAQTKPLSLSRVPPCFLVGDGAYKWACEQGIATVDGSALISDKARRQLQKYKKRALLSPDFDETTNRPRLDTVGAVCVDLEGNVGASSSSGGILLKQPGRVGQAGVYGCGCWAQRNVAVSVSGGGEDLIKSCLARTVAQEIAISPSPNIALNDAIRCSFLESPFLSCGSQKLCGVVVVKWDQDGGGEFLFGHTTSSMGVGYMSTDQSKPKSRISRLPAHAVPGQSIVIEGVCW